VSEERGCVVVFTVEKRGLGKTCGKKNGREAILGVLREGQLKNVERCTLQLIIQHSIEGHQSCLGVSLVDGVD